jgi:hypothetical protein
VFAPEKLRLKIPHIEVVCKIKAVMMVSRLYLLFKNKEILLD